MSTQVDLRSLANPRGTDQTRRAGRRNRFAWLTYFVLPVMLLGGFAGALAYSFREALLPAKPVTVVPALAVRSEVSEPEAPLFQCAGWVEARPTAILVSSLEEGVVEQLLVIEGQELKQGEVIARLIDADAKLRLRDAEAEVNSRRAEVASARATLTAAEVRLREPIERETLLAEAEAMLARVENELYRLPSQRKAAQSRFELAEKDSEGKRQAGDAVSRLGLARAIAEAQSAAAALSELASQQTSLEKELAAQRKRVAGLKRQLELKVEEQRQRDEAKAAFDLAESRLGQAEVALEVAELKLSRMVIKAPAEGKVLSLVARPGTKVMGLAAASMPDASIVVTMYDPRRLQVRADVRLEEVPKVFPGQKVTIETPAVGNPMAGEVIAATSLTDIQKNTLQVKVSIMEPPVVLKPDMLVQVTFLSPPKPGKAKASDDARFTLVIPSDLPFDVEGQTMVWVADRSERTARLQAVTLGGSTSDGMREVKSGLSVGDRLIASGIESLRPGDRIRITGEADSGSGSQTLPAHDHAAKKMKRL
jgi:HlyD family secretion protein